MPMRFCRECNNMLHAKEDKDNKKLLFSCRTCDHEESAESMCVYRNDVQHQLHERTIVLQDVAADPTLPRTHSAQCPNEECRHNEAIFFQAGTKKQREESMSLYFVCTKCQTRWKE